MKVCNRGMLCLFLGLLAILLVAQLFPGLRVEAFSPGSYPDTVENPLLFPEYKKKNVNYGVVFRENDSANNSRLYPVASNSVSPFQQATNNTNKWATPDNGSCAPASFCGALYEPSEVASDIESAPIPFSSPAKRVGFYAAASS
jgi:hypothetical protein